MASARILAPQKVATALSTSPFQIPLEVAEESTSRGSGSPYCSHNPRTWINHEDEEGEREIGGGLVRMW